MSQWGDEESDRTLSHFEWVLDRKTTIGRALVSATRRLQEVGSDSPRLDAELLLAHVLGVSKTWLYTHAERQLRPDEVEQLQTLIARRARREPVAYLIGYREFYGLDFSVDARVLIPRPETELLVDEALTAIRLACRRKGNRDGRSARTIVADIGTGSGAIAVSLAVYEPDVLIYATDISAEALKVATVNIRRYGVENRVILSQGDLLKPLGEPVDVIVANLPYVSEEEWDDLVPDIVQYEPRLALFGGSDGLGLIRRLLGQARQYLRPHGCVLMEIGARQGAAVHDLARHYLPGADVRVLQDYAGWDRILRVQVP
ncbi:MAG TPA: peptide chain release factor N(5)-glutamine methyltransferase [Anaerolineae bacterium]|nr:peptide chain release factor N(5)-glutamine methyltransferase [Anaerolineae bacterium]